MPLGMEQVALDQMDTTNDGMFGVEEAAMLMTNFQQKAAMSHSAFSEPILADETPQMMDSTSSFGPGSMTLPQMQWDAMLPNPESQPKSSSISSAASGQQDSFQYGPELPPLLSSVPLGGEPPLPSIAPSTLMAGGLGTPSALSPYPSMMGPVSPVDYRRSPGPAQICKLAKAPQIQTEEQLMRIMDNIKRYDNEGSLLESFRLPDVTVLNRYLSTYFNLFHHHMPFLHTASFDPSRVSAALLLSVLSIGALYTFEQDQAYMLHIGSKLLVGQFLVNKENFSSRKSPLWAMQATLLNMIFASWSGDPKGLEWACSVKSLVANMVAGNRYELQ